MTKFHPLRFLVTLFTILCCTMIASAAVQEVHAGVIFEKTCVLENETSFSAEFVAAKTPASFFQSTRIEVEALQAQGLSRSEAFSQIRSFNAGNADGYLFHFTNPTNGRAIVNSGEIWATQRGLGGAGVYTGTTPTPNFFQRYFSPVGWGVNPGSGVRIPLRVTPELESLTRMPFLPRWTRIVGDGQSIPLSAP